MNLESIKKICTDPTDVYAHLAADGKHSFLLESAELGEKVARYSFLGRNPDKIISLKDGGLTINGEESVTKDPLKEMANLISRYSVQGGKLPKFFGGLLGYFSYDMVRYFEDIGGPAKDELGQKDSQFMFVKDLIAFDHWREEILLISNLVIEKERYLEREYKKALENISKMETLLGKVVKKSPLTHFKSKSFPRGLK
jgi:anthranilate/para-aminobenzoate synthase component I